MFTRETHSLVSLLCRVCWDYTSVTGTTYNITESFYKRKGAEHVYAVEQFESKRFTFENDETPDGHYSFRLTITSMKFEYL